jgi:uncharacterized membrane protein YiaA
VRELHVADPVRYITLVLGVAVYVLTIRSIAVQLAPYATPVERVRRIVIVGWLAAAVIACVTAAFDRNPGAVILRHALPQSAVVSIGLLVVPARAARMAKAEGLPSPIAASLSWIVAAVVVGAVSVVLLGPGIAVKG